MTVESKPGFMAVEIPRKVGELMGNSQQNPVKVKFKDWLAMHPITVEAAVTTAARVILGAAMGGFVGSLTSSFLMPPPNAAGLTQTRALVARNYAVLGGASSGISCVMKRIRGKDIDDVQTSMAAGFGSGALFSLIGGWGGPITAQNALTSGIYLALAQGGLFKLEQEFSQRPTDDLNYVKTRTMLNNLGLQNYENNFKRGLLTDNTLPLMTDRALREVGIPPGPRLLILEHIEREPEFKNRQKSPR